MPETPSNVPEPSPAPNPSAEAVHGPTTFEPTALTWRRALGPLIMIAAGLACIPFAADLFPQAHAFLRGLPAADKIFTATKQYPNYVTVLLILGAIWQLRRDHRRTIVVLIIAVLVSSTVNEVIKRVMGRARPEYSILLANELEILEDRKKRIRLEKLQELKDADPDSVIHVSTRDQWFPFEFNRPILDDAYASFPSGHSNSAFVISTWLSWLYPPARGVFMFAAAGCAASRVYNSRHYPSDVLVGGGLGWLITLWVLSRRWPMRMADRVWDRSRRKRAARQVAEPPPAAPPAPQSTDEPTMRPEV